MYGLYASVGTNVYLTTICVCWCNSKVLSMYQCKVHMLFSCNVVAPVFNGVVRMSCYSCVLFFFRMPPRRAPVRPNGGDEELPPPPSMAQVLATMEANRV